MNTTIIRELRASDIPAAHALSVQVFGPSAETEKYGIAAWYDHFGEGGLLLGAYQTRRSSDSSLGMYANPEGSIRGLVA